MMLFVNIIAKEKRDDVVRQHHRQRKDPELQGTGPRTTTTGRIEETPRVNRGWCSPPAVREG
jgi:hypothetical protein